MTSEEIKEWRKQKGMSMETLARWLGVSMRTVFRWEHGQAKPSPLAQEKLDKIKLEVK